MHITVHNGANARRREAEEVGVSETIGEGDDEFFDARKPSLGDDELRCTMASDITVLYTGVKSGLNKP